MLDCDYLIIGGGIAAYSAAKRIRKVDASARIILVSDDALPPYNLPPLSKEYLWGEQTDADIVFPALQAGSGSLEIILETAVADLNAEDHKATLADRRQVNFQKALLAPGASPIILPVSGAELDGVLYLRTAADARQIAAAATTARHAIVIGAGFIGLEVAASLRKLGLDVTVVEALDRVWARFGDASVADVIRQHCAGKGVKFLMGERVEAVNGDDGKVQSVSTSGGLEIECDLICVGIGVRPNTDLASAAGIEIANGIFVDEHMQTSAPDIYAAGDVISYPDPIGGRRMRAEHWGHAEYSGQLAGGNMAGGQNAYDFMSYAWSDVFDLHVEIAGYIEDHDQIVRRGEHETDFTSLYLRGGALVGYCAINAEPVEFNTYRKLIRSRQPLGDHIASLRDPAFNVRELLKV